MSENKKYETLRAMLQLGKIKTFEEFAAHLPYATLAKDININSDRMKRLLTTDTQDMTLGELIRISNVLNIQRQLLEDLAINKIERGQS